MTVFERLTIFQAPEGQTLQLRLSTPPSNCMEGCPWQSIELNMGEFERYGMM